MSTAIIDQEMIEDPAFMADAMMEDQDHPAAASASIDASSLPASQAPLLEVVDAEAEMADIEEIAEAEDVEIMDNAHHGGQAQLQSATLISLQEDPAESIALAQPLLASAASEALLGPSSNAVAIVDVTSDLSHKPNGVHQSAEASAASHHSTDQLVDAGYTADVGQPPSAATAQPATAVDTSLVSELEAKASEPPQLAEEHLEAPTAESATADPGGDTTAAEKTQEGEAQLEETEDVANEVDASQPSTAPPVIRLAFDGQDFVVFSEPDGSSFTPATISSTSTSRSRKDSVASAPALEITPGTYSQPLESFFQALRVPEVLGEFLADDTELIMTFPDFDLVLPEVSCKSLPCTITR